MSLVENSGATINGTACRPPRRVVVIALLVLGGIVLFGTRMGWRATFYRETDNAYVSGHVHAVSSRIAGVVTRVLVTDNQEVRAGDLLAELDPADHRVRIEQIRAQIAANDQQLLQADAQIAQASAQAGSAQALTAQAEAELRYASQEAGRYRDLYTAQTPVVAKSQVDAVEATQAGARATVAARSNSAIAARAQVEVAVSARQTLKAQKQVLIAQLRDAEQQLSYNRIVAPVSGRIGKRAVELGTRVQPGQQLLAIVQDEVWVTANFKETQLPGLAVGQTVRVRADAIHDREFTGRIDSIAPASGAQFALLPADNATGNFTRIVQRVPVKITLTSNECKSVVPRLLPGMSAVVEVDLRQPHPSKLAAR